MVGTEIRKGNLSRTAIWTYLLKSSEPEFSNSSSIKEFRNRLNNFDIPIPADFFIDKIIKPIYKQPSDVAAHKVKIPPVRELSDEIIASMLESVGLPPYRAYVVGLKVILEPLQSLD